MRQVPAAPLTRPSELPRDFSHLPSISRARALLVRPAMKLLAVASALALVACVATEDGLETDITKDEAAEMVAGGKADWGFDVCHVMGWYDDGDCDRFCPTIDNDCKLPTPAGFDLRDRYPFADPDLFPESVAFDETRGEFFIGSLQYGNASRLTKTGALSTLFPGTGEAKRTTLGVKFDAPRDRVVMCSYLNVSPATGRLWLFDAATGQRTHDIDLAPAAPNASCNDVVVDAGGNILVTDRELPNIYRVEPAANGTARVTLWTTHPLLAKPRLGIGQNGIAFTADGSAVLTTQYLPGKLHRISTANPREVTNVELSGEHPLPQFLAGADGMVRYGDAMFVAFGSSLLRLRSGDGWRTARMERFELGYKIAAVTVARDQLYVLRSNIPQFLLPGSPGPFELVRFDPRMFDQP